MKMTKRIVAFVLSMVMVFAMMPGVTMAEEQQQPQNEGGNLDVDVSVNFWVLQQKMEVATDDKGNPVQELDEEGKPVTNPGTGEPVYQQRPVVDAEGNPVMEYVQAMFEWDAKLGDYKLNGFNGMFTEEGAANFVKGGYALDSGNKNVLSLQEAFGEKIDEVYLLNVSGETMTKVEGSEFALEEDHWKKELAPAVSYDVAIVPGESDDVTMIWTTNHETADKWIDGEIGGPFADDMYVENGNIEILSIERGDETIYNDKISNECVDISKDFGFVTLKKGDKVTAKLIPDYGYQLITADLNGTPVVAEKEVSTFSFEIKDNVHFSSIFGKVDNKVVGNASAIAGGSVELGKDEIQSGTVNLSVNNTTINAQEQAKFEKTAGTAYAVNTYLDINLNQIVYKGTEKDTWTTSLGHDEALKKPATISLKLEKAMDTDVVEILHEKKDGTQEVIPATYDAKNKTVTFSTTSFSKYAIATKKSVKADSNKNVKKVQVITLTKVKSYKAKKLKKKKVTFSLKAKTNGKGKLTYKVTKGSKKYITVSSKGKVTLKKKCKKGTYKITITASATSKYKKATKVVTIKVK